MTGNTKPILGIDCSRYPLGDNMTGVELYTKRVVDGLLGIDLPFQVRAYARHVLRLPNCEEVVIPNKHFWTRWGLSDELKKHPVDRLFVPSHVLPKNAPAKSFIVIHGLEALYFPEAYTFFARNYQKWSTKFAVEKADTLIAVSHATADDLIKFYHCPPEKVAVVHHGFDPEGLELPKADILTLAKYGLSDEDQYILSVGRIEPRKNQIRLVEAFRLISQNFPKLKLVLAGPPSFDTIAVTRKIELMGSEGRVRMLGAVPHSDLVHLMKGAKIFAYPSLAEGFGLPVLEAFATGTPVLTSSTTALPEVAGDGALLVNPLNTQEIAAGLKQMMLDPKFCADLIMRGKRQLGEFGWEECIAQTAEILQS